MPPLSNILPYKKNCVIYLCTRVVYRNSNDKPDPTARLWRLARMRSSQRCWGPKRRSQTLVDKRTAAGTWDFPSIITANSIASKHRQQCSTISFFTNFPARHPISFTLMDTVLPGRTEAAGSRFGVWLINASPCQPIGPTVHDNLA